MRSERKERQPDGGKSGRQQRGVQSRVANGQDDGQEKQQTLQSEEGKQQSQCERGRRGDHGQAVGEFGPSLGGYPSGWRSMPGGEGTRHFVLVADFPWVCIR